MDLQELIPLASHTMPDFVTPIFTALMTWSALPLIVSACAGAGLGAKPFQWKRVRGAVAGLVGGFIALTPLTLPVIMLGMKFGWPGVIAGGIVACLICMFLTYLVAWNGRPKPQGPVQIVPPED